jgi:acylphosphatase
MVEEISLTLFGRVQGVNLRWMTKNYCDISGIKGYIMNKEDGTVFIVAQGEKNKLNSFLRWIQNNPGLSKIEEMNCKWKTPSMQFKEFSISREKNYVSDKARSIVNLGRRTIKKNRHT